MPLGSAGRLPPLPSTGRRSSPQRRRKSPALRDLSQQSRQAGVAIEDSRAEIVDAHGVRLIADGRKLSARIILISTGGAPVLEPDIPGREYAITSNEIFDLPALPKRMLIVGAAISRFEFAAIFARLGTDVTLVTRGENVLRGF